MKRLPIDLVRYVMTFLTLREVVVARRVARSLARGVLLPHHHVAMFLQSPTVIPNVEVCPPGHIVTMGFDGDGVLHVLCRALDGASEDEVLLSSRRYEDGGFEFVGLETLQGMSVPRLSVIRGRVATLFSPHGRPYCVDCTTFQHYPPLPIACRHVTASFDGTVFVGITEEGVLHVVTTTDPMIQKSWALTVAPRFPMVDRTRVVVSPGHGHTCLVRFMQFANRYGFLSVTWDADFSATSFRQVVCRQSFAAHSEFAIDERGGRFIMCEVLQGQPSLYVGGTDFEDIAHYPVGGGIRDARYWKQIDVVAGGHALCALLHCAADTKMVVMTMTGAMLHVLPVGKASAFAMHPTRPIAALSAWSEMSAEASHPLVAYFECGMVTLVRFDLPAPPMGRTSKVWYWIPIHVGVMSQGLYAILALTLLHLLIIKGWWQTLQQVIVVVP